MKTKLILPGLMILMIGCNTAQQDDKSTVDTADKTTVDTEEKTEIRSQSSVVYDPSDALWRYDYNEQTQEFAIKQLRSFDRDTLTGQTIEGILNTSWPRIQIKFLRTSNDTAFVSIPDSKVLTQQMGTAGAESYMISTTYSLTELEGINHVSFAFEEGDHAIPGVYNRNSWDANRNQ
jgi:hypothetical protein